MQTVSERILAFNKKRVPVPALVKLKFELINKDVFRFYRGTCDIFYDAFSRKINWPDTSKCWITGDLHLENFGTYKGDNGVVYFDQNDFEELAPAPAIRELAGLLNSLPVAAPVLKLNEAMAEKLGGISIEN